MAVTAWPRPSARVQDALLAVFVTLFQIRGTVLVAPSRQVPHLAEPAYLGYLLLAVSGLALVVRRRRPAATFAVVAALNIGYYSAGYPDGPGWVALFVTGYTLTAYGDGIRSVGAVGIGLAVLTVGWLLTADLTPLNAAGWVFFRIGTLVMAAALGESVRARRVLAVEALERARRAEETKEDEARRRVDAERLRIAREVHDTVAHAIAVINVQAGVTAHVLHKRPEQARGTLLTIEQTSARALHELRNTLRMLRDSDDDRAPDPGLDQLENLVATARAAGLDVEVEASAGRAIPGAVDHAAYRILQESITNAVRHAGPTRVVVRLAYSAEDLLIQVVDDGPSRPVPAQMTDGGQGVVGMRERAALLGGELAAGPRPDGGFTVRARLPLPVDGRVAG